MKRRAAAVLEVSRASSKKLGLACSHCSCASSVASVVSGEVLEDVHYAVHKLRDDQNKRCIFSASLEPGKVVHSGDVIEVQTMDAMSGYVSPERFKSGDEIDRGDKFKQYLAGLGVASTNPMCEPIYVTEAQPGDILKVEVLELRSDKYGWNCVRKGGKPFLDDDDIFPVTRVYLWDLHPDTRKDCEIVLSGQRVCVPYRPFLGVMGVAPPMESLEEGQDPGVVSTIPPNINGGNMDNRHLSCEGSIAFFPVFHPGALFSCGDGHAAQGDGEVSGSAIETGMFSKLRLSIIKTSKPGVTPGWRPATPSYITPDAGGTRGPHFGTQGIRDDLHEAARDAVRHMVAWLVEERGLTPTEALGLCSVVGDLKIAEVVDMPKYVVSMHLPLSIFDQPNDKPAL
eukprot:TRINITY_DN62953_c0_g1_i1.p1 TRINITY_DN62953_c0_g1~~TRINITY_DN62953_c0_g1_i1.p1  ORF type:complete len:398 (-),score=75.57 TRINITY_DN62953_c0_g1_i1:165-1358(-)